MTSFLPTDQVPDVGNAGNGRLYPGKISPRAGGHVVVVHAYNSSLPPLPLRSLPQVEMLEYLFSHGEPTDGHVGIVGLRWPTMIRHTHLDRNAYDFYNTGLVRFVSRSLSRLLVTSPESPLLPKQENLLRTSNEVREHGENWASALGCEY